jgi:hypothetical protein
MPLDNSIAVSDSGRRRVGVDYATGEFVVFDFTQKRGGGEGSGPNVFHGHVRKWEQLDQPHCSALIRAGMANTRGKILTGREK